MNIESLTLFFMWCTIINGSIMAFWISICLLAPDLLYRSQNRWFPLPRATFDVIIYSFIGFFKIIFLVLNLIPYVTLLIIS